MVIENNNYAYARKSNVPNAGEDIRGAKRHKWWAKASIAQILSKADDIFNIEKQILQKKDIVKPLDVEGEIANNKSPGHIFYHNFLLQLIPQKFVSEHQLQAVSTCLDVITECAERSNTFTHFTNLLSSDHDLMIASLQVFDKKKHTYWEAIHANYFASSKQVQKAVSNARHLDYEYEKSIDKPVIYQKMRELVNNESNKKSERKMGFATQFRTYQKQMLEKYAQNEENRFNFLCDEAPARIIEDYKFRGLQWGNYVSDKERLIHSKLIYGAFSDLSKSLKLSHNQISLNGNLGIAIGARGSGRASAHYEPLQKVINLTLSHGNGSLAHEWFHAFDHLLFLAMPVVYDSTHKSLSYIKESYINFGDKQKVCENFITDFSELQDDIIGSHFAQFSARIGAYWSRVNELFARAFECFIWQLTQNPYLCYPNIMDKNDTMFSEVYRVYPQGSERNLISMRFARIFIDIHENNLLDKLIKK